MSDIDKWAANEYTKLTGKYGCCSLCMDPTDLSCLGDGDCHCHVTDDVVARALGYVKVLETEQLKGENVWVVILP